MLIVSLWMEFIPELDLEMRLKGIRMGLFYLILPSMLNSFFDFVAGLAGIDLAVPVNVFFFWKTIYLFIWRHLFMEIRSAFFGWNNCLLINIDIMYEIRNMSTEQRQFHHDNKRHWKYASMQVFREFNRENNILCVTSNNKVLSRE